jgi:hypothetical protein
MFRCFVGPKARFRTGSAYPDLRQRPLGAEYEVQAERRALRAAISCFAADVNSENFPRFARFRPFCQARMRPVGLPPRLVVGHLMGFEGLGCGFLVEGSFSGISGWAAAPMSVNMLITCVHIIRKLEKNWGGVPA